MTEQNFDLVVVGCGAGGLSTAVSYLELVPGARVVVLERTPKAQRGGNTTWTGSFFRLEPDGRPATDFESRMHELSDGLTDPAIIRTLAANSQATIRWLADNGVSTTTQSTYFLTSKGPRLMPVGGGAAIVEQLCRRVEEQGGEIVYETAAQKLILDEHGAITGVTATAADGTERCFTAPAVVLACGGFEGSARLLEQHLGPTGSSLPTITQGGRANRGEGIEMAVAAGAATDGQFDRFHGEPVDPRARVGEALVMTYPYGILVDHRGQRFLDEGADTPDNTFEAVAYRIWRDADQFAYLIADQKLARQNYARAVLTDRDPVVADTLDELAECFGLDADALTKTVYAYNEAAVPGPLDTTELDGVSTTGLEPPKSNWARPIDEPPYIAWPVTCAITFTFGGIRTDEQARVLSTDGVPIPHLYAVGEIAGIYHHKYPGATSVLRAVVFGRLAAQHIAQSSEAH